MTLQNTPSRATASHSGWHQNGDLPGSVSKKPPIVTIRNSKPTITRTNHIDVARGSAVAAWQEPTSRIPASKTTEIGLQQQSRQLSAYRRWLNRNKVGLKRGAGAPLQDGDLTRVPLFRPRYKAKYRETLGASVILYLGLGMIAVGLVITIVGIGDANFHTLGLKLIGPVLACLGFVLCGIRVLVCFCASKCSLCDRPVTAEDHLKSTLSMRSRRLDSATLDSKSTMGRRGSDRRFPPSTPIRRPPTPARIVLQGQEGQDISAADSVSLSRSLSFQDSIPTDPDGQSLSSDDSYSLSEFQEIELQNAPRREPVGRSGPNLGDGVILDANALNSKTTTTNQPTK